MSQTSRKSAFLDPSSLPAGHTRWPRHWFHDKRWQWINICSPKGAVFRGPSGPPFSTLPGLCKTLQTLAGVHSQPVFIHGNALCNISNASHQLLTADSYRCLVSSLKRQEKQIEWGKLETQRTRAEPKWEDNVALMRKVAKMRQKRSRTRNLCMRRLRSMSERTQPQPPPLNWTGFLNISAMSLASYAAVCGGDIHFSAVVQQHCSFDSLLGRGERKTDLAVLRSLCPAGMLFVGFSFKFWDDTKWRSMIKKKRRKLKHEATKYFFSIDKKKQTGLNMGDEVSRYTN